MRTLVIRLVQVLAGLASGVVVAEVAFHVRDHGAFPHVNFYVPDPVLGIRLEKHASENLEFGGNPVTHVRTNDLGFRGADWGAPDAKDVLVVGDSQVFGLGVDEQQTFSSVLADKTKRHVLNAGVPTYGPDEYAAVVDEVLRTRKPSHVIFVINMANDLFELVHKNVDRHAVWDGWAVRTETAPIDVVNFPGRRFLFSQSHLIFAARKLIIEDRPGAEMSERGFPSEGSVDDLREAATKTMALPHAVAPLSPRDPRWRDVELARSELMEADAEIDVAAGSRLGAAADDAAAEAQRIAQARGSATDIFEDRHTEGGRALFVTASELLGAAIAREKNAAALAALAVRKHDERVKAILDERHAAEATVDALARPSNLEAPPPSPLEQVLSRVKQRCDQAGARLIVVVLPLDVMVSDKEWAKYGKPAQDMSPTHFLVDSVMKSAHDVGAVALDATPALAAAEPGAFLNQDLHMTPKGHAALAAAIAPKLDELPPLAHPRPGLPDGRSFVPSRTEWDRVVERDVVGSTGAACETKQVREWLKVACHASESLVPTGVVVESGGHGDALAIARLTSAVLTAPVLRGETIVARFFWRSQSRRFVIDWPQSEAQPKLAFLDVEPPRAAPPIPMELAVEIDEVCDRTNVFSEIGLRDCDKIYGSYTDGCPVFATVECFQADPEARPACKADEDNAGAAGRCAKLCDAARPCTAPLTCQQWMGAGVCLAP